MPTKRHWWPMTKDKRAPAVMLDDFLCNRLPRQYALDQKPRKYHPTYSLTYPSEKLLLLLQNDKTTILALRAVSRQLKQRLAAITKPVLDPFNTVTFTYPAIDSPHRYSSRCRKSVEALKSVFEHVGTLQIKVFPSITNVTTDDYGHIQSVLAALPRLCTISISLAPSPAVNTPREAAAPWLFQISRHPTPSHSAPLVSIRHALETSRSSLLRSVTFSHLSIAGVMALRFGPFSAHPFQPIQIGIEGTPTLGDTDTTTASIPDWMGPRFWRELSFLGISLVKWWDIDFLSSRPGPALYDLGPSVDHPRLVRDRYRAGLQFLNDWLASFADWLRFLKFEWETLEYVVTTPHGKRIRICEGPNPLLIDLVARDSKKAWYSAPPIRWRHLQEATLGPMSVTPGMQAEHWRKRVAKTTVIRVDPQPTTALEP